MSSKNSLTIRLTESVVFLRGLTDLPRRSHNLCDSAPAMLRGLLTLHLTKPTRISSIELELEGKCSIQWPESTGHRPVDIPEEKKLLSARTVFFTAKACPSSTRSASLGPGTRGLDDGDDDLDDDSRPSIARSSRYAPSRSSFDPPSPHLDVNGVTTLRSPRRNSVDQYGWQRNPVDQDTAATLSDYPPTPPASPLPRTPVFDESAISRPQTPTHSRPESSTRQHYPRRSPRAEEDPGQMLAEFRNALKVEMGTVRSRRSGTPSAPRTPDPLLVDSSASPAGSFTGSPSRSESAPGSRSTSRDVEYQHQHPSTSIHARATSLSRTFSPTFSSSFEHERDQTHVPDRRAAPRWILSNMSSVLKDAKDKIRSGSPKETEVRRGRTAERRAVNGNGTEQYVNFVMTNDDYDGKRRDKERKSALGKLTAAVRHDELSSVDGWKEFRKGTYTYPISFIIPSTAPPTVHCDFGVVVYHLKAVVHRPGALTTKLVVSREVTFVAAPADDDMEEAQSIVVERQWDAQLRYLIALSGRSFVIGSQIPFNFTMIPLEKCKVYRLSVSLEEKTEYFSPSRNLAREQPVRRFELLSIRHAEKNPPPILPVTGGDMSLLMPYLDTSSLFSSADEALSSLMGHGPWVLTHNLQLPSECGRIHFTYKHKGADITISHTLKIVLRVERGDDQCLDPKTGNRRLFDIVVQTPIHILSCHCNPERMMLPRYTLFATGPSDGSIGSSGLTCACSGGSATLPSAFSRYRPSSAVARSTSRPSTAEQHPNGNVKPCGAVDAVAASLDLADSSHLFARLMSGQEGVFGEVPPLYQEGPAARE